MLHTYIILLLYSPFPFAYPREKVSRPMRRRDTVAMIIARTQVHIHTHNRSQCLELQRVHNQTINLRNIHMAAQANRIGRCTAHVMRWGCTPRARADPGTLGWLTILLFATIARTHDLQPRANRFGGWTEQG